MVHKSQMKKIRGKKPHFLKNNFWSKSQRWKCQPKDLEFKSTCNNTCSCLEYVPDIRDMLLVIDWYPHPIPVSLFLTPQENLFNYLVLILFTIVATKIFIDLQCSPTTGLTLIPCFAKMLINIQWDGNNLPCHWYIDRQNVGWFRDLCIDQTFWL